MKYSIELAALGSALIIALAIVFTGRWEITSAPNAQTLAVYRLDRWTGQVRVCSARNTGLPAIALGFGLGLRCTAATQSDIDGLKNQPGP